MKLFYETAISGMMIAAIYAVLASTVAFLFRVSHQLNLAHGDIMIVGAYVGYFIARAGGNLASAIFGGLAAGAISGAAVYFCIFRWLLGARSHIYLVAGVALSALIEESLNITVNGGNAVAFPPRLVAGGGDLTLASTV